jgi:simple sugar transport system substrate-binding protein
MVSQRNYENRELVRMMKRIVTLGVALALAAAASTGATAQKLKVGFVYVGPIGDHGWTYQHDQGRIKMEKYFAGKVETTYVESVSEGADAERVIRQLAASGHDVIYTTSFGYMNATNKVAKMFPKVIFEHATGYKRAKNVGTYLSTTYEGRYISGFIGASMAKSGKVGYIASFPIPEVIRDINAVMLGMQRVNPKAELKIVWVSTWYDPGKERAAAEVLMDQGVDVIIQHTDSPAAMQAANARGKFAVGQASDMSRFGPKSHLHSVVNDWSKHYISSIGSVLDGTWKSRDYWGGMKDGVIVIPKFSDQIPAATRARALAMIEGIKDGTGHPFAGPIYDQSGKLRVAKGKHMTNGELATMNWYVQGVKGSIPK